MGWKLRQDLPRAHAVLELGSNAGCIVDETVAPTEIQNICQTLAIAATSGAGQSCISTQRLFVHESLFSLFLDELVQVFRQRSAFGQPEDADTTTSPLIDAASKKRVADYLTAYQAAGAKIVCGGNWNGLTLAPTLVTNLPDRQPLNDTEAFAPILCVYPFAAFE